ncbi:hypothetical protein YPPY53_2679, partial [Yersinia pestis PY-53]
MSPSVTATSR